MARVRFRPPGVKPGAKVGPWGPFRGRLGAHWWIGALVVGTLLLIFGTWFFLQGARPAAPWTPVARVESIEPASAREVRPGIFVGRLPDGRPVAVRERPECPLVLTRDGYQDCAGATFDLTGRSGDGAPLSPVPVQVYRDEIFIRT